MRIQPANGPTKIERKPVRQGQGETVQPGTASKDGVEIANESTRNERVLGTVGAGIGAISGRIGLLVGASAAGAVAGSAVLGPIGGVVGGVVGGVLGLGAGAFVEFRDKAFKGVEIMGKRMPLGRIVGGVAGGLIGSTVGKLLDKVPFKKPRLGSEALNQESKGFSLKKLFKNVGNVNHTSLPTMDEAGRTKEIAGLLKPGDIVMTNSDLWMDFEIPMKLTGSKGDWTHTAVYDGKGQSIEALASRGVVARPVEELIGENHHVRVLRPKYPEGGAQAAIDYARSKIGAPYDFKFSGGDDSFYCIELTQKALNVSAPSIQVSTSKLFWDKLGPEVVTPADFNRTVEANENLEVVYDTGSNFNRNYLAKFS